MSKKKKMPNGGKIKALTPEDAAIAKVLMERNRGKNFVDRAFDQNQQSIQVPGEPGRSTHLMAYDGNRVYPTVVQLPDGTLKHLDGDEAWDYADQTGEYITTPTEKIADMLSNYGYKKAAGMPTNEFGSTMKKVTYGGGNATKKTSKKKLNKVMPIKADDGATIRKKWQDQSNSGNESWNHDKSKYDPTNVKPIQQDVADLKGGKLGDLGNKLVSTPNGVSKVDGWNGSQTGNYKYRNLVYEHQDAKGNVISSKNYGYDYEKGIAENSNGKWFDDKPVAAQQPAQPQPTGSVPLQNQSLGMVAPTQLENPQQGHDLTPKDKLYSYLGSPQPSVPSDDYNQFDPKWRSNNFMHPDTMSTDTTAQSSTDAITNKTTSKSPINFSLSLSSNDLIAGGLALGAGMLPDQIKRDNQNNNKIEYNPHPYGDNTQAIAESGIHIKPSHRGKFTAWKKKHHQTTEQALHSKSAAVRKMANFARNAKKWKHEDGGEIESEDIQNNFDLYKDGGILMLGEGGIKPYGKNAHSNPMMVSNGPSHDEGGMPINVSGQNAEIQGGEGVQQFNDGSTVIFGGMKIPNLGPETKGLAGRTIQSVAKGIAKEEEKNTKRMLIPSEDTEGLNPENKFDSATLGSKIAMGVGYRMRSAALTAQKDHLRNIQDNLQAIGDKEGVDYDKVHSVFAKNGATIKAKEGAVLEQQRQMMKEHPDWVNEALTKYGKPRSGRFDDGLDGPRTQFVKNYFTKKQGQAGISKPNFGPQGDPNDFSVPSYIKSTYDPQPGVVETPLDPANNAPWRANMLDIQAQDNINYRKNMTTPNNKMRSLADQNNLRASDFLSELSYLGKRPDQVVGQEYKPYLQTPYAVSFQDMRNQNQSTFNELSKQLQGSGSAASLAALAGQKYEADNRINAEEFRTNQGIFNQITNQNYATLNDANKFNTQLKDQQYVRQSQAKSNTDSQRAQALASISNKIAAKRYENMNIRLIEERSGFRWNPNTKRLEWEGGPWNFNTDGSTASNSSPYASVQEEYGPTGDLIKTVKTKKAISKFGNVFGK